MRRTVPWAVALFLLAVGTAMGAAAMGGAPQSSVISDLAQWIVGNVIALCGVFVAATRATQVWLRGHVASMLATHDGLDEAHKAASAHNHGPMTSQMNRIEMAVADIKSDIRALVEGQRIAVEELAEQDTRLVNVESKLTTLCAEHHILHGRAMARRDPKDSPSPKRAGDSGDDYTPLRGVK